MQIWQLETRILKCNGYIIDDMIAILATGDELTNGDILNTNGRYIAQTLFDHNLAPGIQMVVPDDQTKLEQAIKYLLGEHQGLITIGGLGPTSDDLTRFALSSVIAQPLEFDEASWQQLTQRLQKLNLDIPDNNRQQCLFPKGANVIENNRGTANACYTTFNGKPIFMLPGPPRECEPLLNSDIIPTLTELGMTQAHYRACWTLLGIGEGNLAQQLDPTAKQFNVQIGYRAAIPYIELKLDAAETKPLEEAKKAITPLIKQFIVSKNRETARDLLYNYLINNDKKITIIDNATKGYLAQELLTRETVNKITFPEHPMSNTGLTLIISGLHRYWQAENSNLFVIDLLILEPMKPARSLQLKLPNRGQHTLAYASAFLCWRILQFLTT